MEDAVTVQAPLLQQVQTILGNMGFEPAYPGGAGLYQKRDSITHKLSAEFYRVTGRTIQKGGYPIPPVLSHSEFIVQNTQYLLD